MCHHNQGHNQQNSYVLAFVLHSFLQIIVSAVHTMYTYTLIALLSVLLAVGLHECRPNATLVE